MNPESTTTDTQVIDRRLPKLRVSLVGACFAMVGVVALLAVFGPLLAPQDPAAQDLTNVTAAPSGEHWLGTDALGRDIFSRVVVGARTAVVGPLVIAAGSFLVGNLLGLWAGYRSGWTDSIVMRWVDIMWSIPTLLVLIVLAGAFGANYWAAVGIVLVLTVPFDTRVVRGATLEQTPRAYVEAARSLGVADRRIMVRHIWPNVAHVALPNAFLNFAASVVVLTGLSFLGLGTPPGTPDWGLMLAENQTLLFLHPAATFVPGALIVMTATAMILIGDWLHHRIADMGTGR